MSYNPMTNYLVRNPEIQQSAMPSITTQQPMQSRPGFPQLPYNQPFYGNQQPAVQPNSQSIFYQLNQQRQNALNNPAPTMYGANSGGNLNSPVLPQQNMNIQALMQELQKRGGMGNGVGKGGGGVGKGGGIRQGISGPGITGLR